MWGFSNGTGRPRPLFTHNELATQRLVFVVRAVDPVWAITYKVNQPQEPTTDPREQMMHILNNLGWQVPVGRKVYLTDDEDADNICTSEPIREKLGGYDLTEMPFDITPDTRLPARKWIRAIMEDIGTWQCLVIVVRQTTYDRWCEELDLPLWKLPGDKQFSTILQLRGDGEELITIESVA